MFPKRYLEGLPGVVQHLLCCQDVRLDLLQVTVAEPLQTVLQLPTHALRQLHQRRGTDTHTAGDAVTI